MMLRPVNVLQSRLDTSLLKFYDEDTDFHEVMGGLYLRINNKKIVSCSSWWDPAFGADRGDNSVFAIVFTDEEGDYYLHHVAYIKTRNNGLDEATDQCQQVTDIVKKYYVPSVTIETNGIGKFLPSILKRELGKQNISCSVIEKNNSQPKHIRILEAFDAVLAAKALSVHESAKATPFVHEMMEWKPESKSGFDDGLDAVAGALLSEPIRIKRFYATTQTKWKGSGESYIAQTDFNLE